jgi:hypothetical protein
MMIPFLNYQFTADPTLSTSPGSAIAYELVSDIDAETAASEIAQVLGIAGQVTDNGDGSFQVGDGSGPTVDTWTSSGIVEWSFASNSASVISTPGSSSSDGSTSTGDAPVPTSDQASSDALAFLASLGVTDSLGAPQLTSSDAEVDVSVPMLAGGLATDQADEVAYGPGGTVDWANGILASITAGPAYPTIAPTDAVSILQNDHGFVFYGGVAPWGGPRAAGAGAGGAGGGGGGGAPPPPTTTTTTDTPTDSPPEVDVDINAATLQYSTYSLTDGTSWLLPTWVLSGPETGSTVSPGASYSNNILAVSSQYVQLQQGPMVF